MSSTHTDRKIKALVRTLIKNRKTRTFHFPIKTEAQRFVDELLEFLFPHFSEKVYFTPEEVEAKLILLQRNLKSILKPLLIASKLSFEKITKRFFSQLPDIHTKLWKDARAIEAGDPAAESLEEVVLAYPGFLAIAIYRIAHEFYQLKVPIFPRIITEYAHQMTGIDIHPGAEIGSPFFIDHGTGIVIGETTVIGRNVKMYQGVTLGALSVDKKQSKIMRHPTIEDNVIIYAQAVILGGNTTIGHHSVIGGNTWLTKSVPPYSTVYNESKVNVRRKINHETKKRQIGEVENIRRLEVW
ncbi:MAG: serine acetyltransferase [Bacteroidetes bacterium]|nr:serine acetyltransferase [Bacteroidota bacterium]MBU1423141.1 serine acetyltransferase [Bacteroidota bacterium]MBU2471058.1 serine acetyltransferase [Bacteroidota bacterium]MBU2636358.1 serine acetyltransferase [Bacteroidota bacterium]